MAQPSRRNFLKQASLSAVAVGAVAVSPALLSVGEASAAGRPAGPGHDGPFMAYVRDPHAGDIVVMVGEHEVVHNDPDLAARLARIAVGAR